MTISFITIANGRIGETRFVNSYSESYIQDIKKKALDGVYQSEILEWYRNQYNISMQEFQEKPVDYDAAHLDFYRRQFWAEIKWGIRKWGDDSPDLKMPPFTMLRPYGGVLPPPNGFDINDDYTVSIEKYSQAPESNDDEDEAIEVQEDDGYTRITNKSIPSHVTKFAGSSSQGQTQSVDMTYGMDDENFWKMIDEEWETMDSIDGPENIGGEQP